MSLYPEIEPYEQGMLDTGDGNLLHWEAPAIPPPNWPRTRRSTCSRTSRCCAATWASRAGWCSGAPGDRRSAWPTPSDGDLAAVYSRLLEGHDEAKRAKAARDWCDRETALAPAAARPITRYESPTFRLAFARIVTHYWGHGSWLDEGSLLRGAELLAGIPGALVAATDRFAKR
jgi:hypothetical protein